MPLPQADYIASLRKDLEIQDVLRHQPLRFATTWGLFSPKEIDQGTRLLLDFMEINPTDDCLDLGCGYGPIGLTVAKLAPQGRTLMVDNNFVAVDYANKNAQLNGLSNAEARLSHGFDQVGERKFDIVVSNLPAKVGKEMWQLYLYDAYQHLNPGGRLYMVTISGLRDFIKRNFKDYFGNYKKLKQGKSYTVALAIKEP